MTVSDNVNGAYTQAVTEQAGTDHQAYIFYRENAAAGTPTVTVSLSGAAATLRFTTAEYSGISTAGSLDKTSGASGTGTAINSGTVTTTQGMELLVGLSTNNDSGTNNWSAAPGWTIRASIPCNASNCVMTEDSIVSSVGTYANNPTASLSLNWASVVATFKGTGPVASAETNIFTRNLSVGSVGADVSALQQVLKVKGFYTYTQISGYFGAITKQAVASFQVANALEAVGAVGPKTLKVLNSLLQLQAH